MTRTNLFLDAVRAALSGTFLTDSETRMALRATMKRDKEGVRIAAAKIADARRAATVGYGK